MTRRWRRTFSAMLGTILLVVALPAWAVEYRLQVASIYEDGLTSFLKRAEYTDGASGPGLDRLEKSLDTGGFPKAVLLYDRPLQPMNEIAARAWGGAPVRAEVLRGGTVRSLWDEVRWEGKPGEQTVWVVAPGRPRDQELYRVALKGRGPLRQFQPVVNANRTKVGAAVFSLGFLSGQEERGAVWEKYVSRSIDTSHGIAAVIGLNDSLIFADNVYLVVNGSEQPTTSKAVLVWRRREHVDRGNIEGGGGGPSDFGR